MAQFARALRSVGEPIFGADASRISMANLLAYLFEVTERFGMATRTELILLQRTMVVVEGVARSLDPQINMWAAARPVVERYIRDNLGSRAAARDGLRAMQALGRHGPLLPELVDRQIDRLSRPEPPAVVVERSRSGEAVWAVVLLGLGVLVGLALG